MGTNCFACEHPLTGADPRDMTCSNSACPEGGVFYYCGYCRGAAFARTRDRRYCVNPRCPSYRFRRDDCKSCGKVSIMTLRGVTICVNRDCPDNKSLLSTCFFCGNSAFFQRDDLMFCTKGRCSYVFQQVEECAHCGKRSYLVETEVCGNPECPQEATPATKSSGTA